VLVAVHAWVPPGGDLAERRYPSPHLRKIWADAAIGRLEAALRAAWGSAPADVEFQPMVVRGETGRVLVEVADGADDLLVVGPVGAALLPASGTAMSLAIALGMLGVRCSQYRQRRWPAVARGHGRGAGS
jgi:hypothetical protein